MFSLPLFVVVALLPHSLTEEVKILNFKALGSPELHKREVEHINKNHAPLTETFPLGYVQSAINTNVPNVVVVPPVKGAELHKVVEGNPLLAALLLSYSLGIVPNSPGFNHPQHLPINPYVALLLSHYGRYVPLPGYSHGIYGYTAANNLHNNQPFGAYKIYEDRDV